MRLSWKDFFEKRAQSVIGPAWGGTWGVYWPRSNGSSGKPALKPQAPAQVREFEIPQDVRYFFDKIKHGIDPERYPVGFYNFPNRTHKEDGEDNTGSYSHSSGVRPTVNLNKRIYPNLADVNMKRGIQGTAAHEFQHDVHNRMKMLTPKQIEMLRLAYPHAIEGIRRHYSGKGVKPGQEMEDLVNNELEAINSAHQIRLMTNLEDQLGRKPSRREFGDHVASLSYPDANGHLAGVTSGYEDRSKVPQFGFWTQQLENVNSSIKGEKEWLDSLDKEQGPDPRRRRFFLEESPVHRQYLEDKKELEEKLKSGKGKENIDAYKWVLDNVKYSPRPTGWHRMI